MKNFFKKLVIYLVSAFIGLYTLFNAYEDIERLLGRAQRVHTRKGRKRDENGLLEKEECLEFD